MPPDSLRRALSEVFARPEYRWVERTNPIQWLMDLWHRLQDWLDAVQTSHPAGFKVLLAGLVLLLVAMFAHIGYVVWRITRPTIRAPVGPAGAAAGPLEDAGAHLIRAGELARAGRYAEALAHRFIAVVLQLERAQALTFHLSKTPAEYLAEARLDGAGRESLAELVARLYRHLFGGVPCDEGGYREFGATAQLVLRHVTSG